MTTPAPASSPAHGPSTGPPSGPLKILHVIPSMAAEVGGPPAVCAGLAGATAARGHAVTIASVHLPDSTPVAAPPAVTALTFPPDPGASALYLKSTSLDTWLNQHSPAFDIVHLHSLWQFPTFAAARACRRTRTPYVVLLNGMLDRYAVAQRSGLLKRAYWLYRERSIHAHAAALHCLNQAEINNAVPWIRPFPKFILGNGIAAADLAALPPKGRFRAAHPELANRPIALFLSRLHPKKGLDRLLPAWAPFTKSHPDARLVIAGTGDPTYLAHLDKLIADHHLQNHVLRVGQLVGPQKWEALADADLFVLPSHQEGFSMAITEALAAGCPPVVTNECNFDELRTHNCGITIPNGDMPAFVNECIALLNAPDRRTSLAANGKQLVTQNFTWEIIAQHLESTYKTLIARHPLPTP